MRILSQKGMVFNDIPYDKFCFGIVKDDMSDKFYIVASNNVVERSAFPYHGVLAEYSTENKAQIVMENLRLKYSRIRVACPPFETVILDNSQVFRFPTDSELDKKPTYMNCYNNE